MISYSLSQVAAEGWGRVSARPAANLDGRPLWRWVGVVGRPVWVWRRRARLPGRVVAGVADGLLALVWVTGRDLAQAVRAHARPSGESRRAAMARGAGAVRAQRSSREAAIADAAGTVRPARARVVAAVVLVALVVMALVVAPDLAAHTTYGMRHVDPSWLAGILDQLSGWWHSLSFGQQMAIGLLVVALLLFSGGSLGMAMWTAGALMWAADKSAGIATFLRNPGQATRDYLTTTTPAQMAADAASFLLTFAAGMGGRAAEEEMALYRADPAAWRAAHPRDDAGHVELPFGGGGMDDCSDAAFGGVPHIREEIAKEGPGGSHSWASGMTDDQIADYLDSYVKRPEFQLFEHGEKVWYDSERGLVIIKRSEWSSTAYRMSYEEFLRKLV